MVLGLIQFKLTRSWLGAAGTQRGNDTPLHPVEKFGLIAGIAALVVVVGLGMSGALTFNPIKIAGAMKWVLIAIGVGYFLYLFLLAGLNGDEKKRVGVIVALFITSALFWMGFEQVGSSFNMFAKRYTIRTTGLDFSNISSNDVQNLPALASRLSSQADGVSRHVWSQLPTNTQNALLEFTRNSNASAEPLRAALLRGLNKVVNGDLIHDEQRFADVNLSPTTAALLAEQESLKAQRKELNDDKRARLNRLLLEDGLAPLLSQNQNVHPSFVVPAGWFQSLGAIMIIIFAPMFAALWVRLAQRNLDPSVPVKFAFGLLLLALGFVVMAGAAVVVAGGSKVMPTWLTLTYLLHTFGELCLSPVGLSSVTKLAPRKYVGQMMGIWFLATSLGNLMAGLLAGDFTEDTLQQWPGLYLRIAIAPTVAGVLLILLARPIKRLMKGIN
jgi:dipeptide/tripeptide permease